MTHIVPRATERFLKTYGGANPFGKPNWRVLVASDRLVKEAGVYRDWQEGLTTAEKGGLNFTPNEQVVGMDFRRHDNKPLRVVTEMRETPMYPHVSGWILERWFPATKYGSREEWHAFKAVDGITPILGPYPEEGDYECLFILGIKLPSTDILQKHISSYTTGIANKKGTPESRIQQYVMRREYEIEQAEIKRKAEYAAQMADELTPMHSSSLAASRWRNQLAARIGIRSHVGIL